MSSLCYYALVLASTKSWQRRLVPRHQWWKIQYATDKRYRREVQLWKHWNSTSSRESKEQVSRWISQVCCSMSLCEVLRLSCRERKPFTSVSVHKYTPSSNLPSDSKEWRLEQVSSHKKRRHKCSICLCYVSLIGGMYLFYCRDTMTQTISWNISYLALLNLISKNKQPRVARLSRSPELGTIQF